MPEIINRTPAERRERVVVETTPAKFTLELTDAECRELMFDLIAMDRKNLRPDTQKLYDLLANRNHNASR